MALPKYSVLQVKPAKDSLIGQSAFVQFLSSLKTSLKANFFDRFLASYETICLEIINLNQTTFFVVSCPERMEHLVRSQLAAQYPDALITPMQDYLPTWLHHGQAQVGQLTLTGPSYLPINATDEKDVDQVAAILGGLSRLAPGQAAILQLCLFAAPKGWQRHTRSILDAGVPGAEPDKTKAHPLKALIENKLAYQAFSFDLRLVAITPDAHQSQNLLGQLAASYGTYTSSEGNGFKLKVPRPASRTKLLRSIEERTARYAISGNFLNYFEIAALYHLPNANLAAIKNIAWGKTLKGEPPPSLPVDEGLLDDQRQELNLFARTEFKNHLVTFGMRKGDDRRRHVYVLGKSGTGKSTLLANMAINDIRHGEGIALVDPHGDTADHLLDYIPADRIQDVAYLDPSISGQSFHLNPLFVKNQAYAELVASGIVSIFSKLYGNSWGPRLEYILRNTLLTLVHKSGSTLLDVPRVLTDKPFREEYLQSVNDPVLINFWHNEYDKYSERFQSEAISPILNKVGQFITSPTIRDIISHPESTVDFEDMMNSGKIIILNLSQGRIGEDNAALLGAMFISQIQIAAMNRAAMAEESRKDFFLYVDEFQNFATTSFIKILSEARKYRLNLILANQYTAQLPEEIQDAIFGNAGTIISFVVGAADANRLMNELGNLYTQDDLVSLARYQVIIKMSVNATISMPFPAYTMPLPKDTAPNRQQVIQASLTAFYRKTEPMDMSHVVTVAPQPRQYEKRRPPSYQPRNEPPRPSGSQERSRPSDPGNDRLSQSRQPRPAAPTYVPHVPTLEELDKIRKQGLRPSVVGCFVNKGKLLLLYQKIHNMWTLPQGGVDNHETLIQAFKREMADEVTSDFADKAKPDDMPIAENKIEFPPGKQNLRELKSDSGEPLNMKGKYYYFVIARTDSSELTISASEFDQYKWVGYDEAYKLVKDTNAGGKLRITAQVLNTLRDKGILEGGRQPAKRPNYQSNNKNGIKKPNRPDRHHPQGQHSGPKPSGATHAPATTG